jgi:hypothetical protein
MADPKEWGPTVWKIIHIISEQLGKNTNTIMQKDEMTYYKAFQRKIYYILPCKICREHYKEQYKNIKDIEYTNFKTYSKTFYLNLHNEINLRNSINQYTFQDLDIYKQYTKDDLDKIITEFTTLYRKYTNLKYIAYDELKDFNRILILLRRFINF